MALRRTPAGESFAADPPSEVQVSVIVSHRGRTPRELVGDGIGARARIAAAVAGGAALTAVVVGLALISFHGTGSVSDAAATPLRDPGPAGVAAAYRYPAGCLSVAFASADRSYARAWLDRASPCWRYGVWMTAVFHRENGVWHQALTAAAYSCPVRSLPRIVQRQLGVCP